MSQDYYSPDALCRDLDDLLKLDPSKPQERDTWVAKAQKIRERLKEFMNLDRSVFDYVWYFVDDGVFMSKHSDYYASESVKIRRCMYEYQVNGRL